MVLLLTGSIQGLKNAVNSYLDVYHKYDYLWQDDKLKSYNRFMKQQPSLSDYRRELDGFMKVRGFGNEHSLITFVH